MYTSFLLGTLAGQIVMEGFINMRLSPVYRRLITRSIAIVPAIIFASIGGEAYVNNLLIISQVVLSFALPFAIFPLIQFTSDARKMGVLVNAWYTQIVAYVVFAVVTVLNFYLLYEFCSTI